MHVVILAAGLGRRLGVDHPKPLTGIAPGRTLLSNQIDILGDLIGRERIVLVIGHQAMDVIRAHPHFIYAYNPRYAETNTAKSLLCALRHLDDDVLWTNGDLYFEPGAARRFVEAEALRSRLLVNRRDTAAEEVKYTLDGEGFVRALSKQAPDAAGESLGMQMVTRAERPALLDRLDAAADQDYFEKALEDCVQAGAMRLGVVDVGDEFCREVDDAADLEAVRARAAARFREQRS